MDYDELAREYGKEIATSLDGLNVRYHKITGDLLSITEEEIEIIAWQWFYNDIMEAV